MEHSESMCAKVRESKLLSMEWEAHSHSKLAASKVLCSLFASPQYSLSCEVDRDTDGDYLDK